MTPSSEAAQGGWRANPSDPRLAAGVGMGHAIRQVIFGLLAGRAVTATICPSEVARKLRPATETDAAGEDWRLLMPAVRRVAQELMEEGLIEITSQGQPVPDLNRHRGPIRLRRCRAALLLRA